MPNKCCVPGCTGNYKTGKKIQVFSFPKDADALKQWLRAIPRKDFVPTSCTKVCADHFDASCIEKTTSYTDPRTGRVIEVALRVPRLRPGSVPTVFPGCPSYLSVRDQSTRETPDAKRSRQEASQLARAVEESLASYEAEQERDRFSSLEELRARLQGVSVSPKWTVIHKEECSMFLNIIDYREPCLNASLTVFANLEVFACYQGSPIKNLGSAVVPDSVQKVSSLLEILNNLSMLSEERCTYRHLAQAIHSLLDKLEASIDEGKKETVNFMKEQLLLLSAKRIQYSAQVMVFACILRTMSPHAYKFLRSTGTSPESVGVKGARGKRSRLAQPPSEGRPAGRRDVTSPTSRHVTRRPEKLPGVMHILACRRAPYCVALTHARFSMSGVPSSRKEGYAVLSGIIATDPTMARKPLKLDLVACFCDVVKKLDNFLLSHGDSSANLREQSAKTSSGHAPNSRSDPRCPGLVSALKSSGAFWTEHRPTSPPGWSEATFFTASRCSGLGANVRSRLQWLSGFSTPCPGHSLQSSVTYTPKRRHGVGQRLKLEPASYTRRRVSPWTLLRWTQRHVARCCGHRNDGARECGFLDLVSWDRRMLTITT
ncbi:hypothetical protein HPB51_004272 [Rhipicephalus microplus]|uniref:THAP-type domain-containing protein n=1 Tax=Rhipicephalus microplus TaxID=6941 RepID=A0A9J6DKT7_RHIMP|nr:hypothetical protein HPB51_004272 [Rhipicephalus microplus]